MIVISRGLLIVISLAWVTAGAAVGLAVGWGCRP